MGDIAYLNQYHEDAVRCFEYALESAKAGEVRVALVINMDPEGNITYSRAGTIQNPSDILSIIGSLEHHKAALIEILMEFEQAALAAAEEEEDEDEPADPT